MSAITFACACCGREVTGAPDIAFAAPHHYDALPRVDRDEHARLDADFCVIDEDQRFIRAVCSVPIVGTDEVFAWGVWVSLSAENFARYRATFADADQARLGEMFAWLCNRIPGYPDTLHLQTTVVPQDGRQRPLVWINGAHADHPLYVEQRQGITTARLSEIYAREICDGRRGGA